MRMRPPYERRGRSRVAAPGWLSDCDTLIASLFRADEAHGLSLVALIQRIGALSALVEDVAMLRDECDAELEPVE